ncbi:alpha/beta fold hydrolase [Natronobacterium gregoryi]|uniref:Alpha/beta hydrolase n=2 Tax=Natronobacterium gregoryi TaxID=44930 RepID=L0AMA0_NATGS|nr:alpha/beta hydrolase [Natronobacterium gregoryi]AFZ74160.1 putative hydrolase or acyltransferase of alpha/beta superfamily [Natronobacterium gregoryi SP2]ELY63615.1 alpha/beta hydrolase [Natronobacterium gregoryi SP2]PLK22047.1 alpha/beta hydrolase [Natronobacterium gregoryi SP2]SFI50579.1 Pimeloyl-ACP methyl ester carboxylesterase [Natronobacterium gregoryi]
MERVSHHGRETAYETVDGGDGSTICLVHGTGGNRDLWQKQHALATDRPLVTLDLSGHGDSDDIDASPGYATFSAYVDDVLAVAEATDSRVLVGGSMGGAVVLHLLLERSFRPDAVVLTGTGARLGVLEDLLAWLENNFDRAVEFLHAQDRFFHDTDRDVVALSKEAMYDAGQEVTSRDFHSCHGFDVRERLSEIDVPVLVVYGEYDRLTPPWFHEYLADEIPDTDLVEIEDAAQRAMLERPEPFNEAVRSFL